MGQSFASVQTAVVTPDIGAKTIQFTRDMTLATGSQAVTGVGFVPKMIVVYASQSNLTQQASWGFTSSIFGVSLPQRSIHDNGYFLADAFFNNTVPIRIRQDVTDTIRYRGTVASFDSDGFTIDWIKQGATTGSMTCTALCVR